MKKAASLVDSRQLSGSTHVQTSRLSDGFEERLNGNSWPISPTDRRMVKDLFDIELRKTTNHDCSGDPNHSRKLVGRLAIAIPIYSVSE
ncbi:hypothetical protein [Paraburkholderia hospita]|jgi:hypothetical protein|uniref:hypothetical protein n=1 Tax=Paraburkholderia hospita TaxID=169430 RepID=UPI0012602ECC|nr:hypothetical protein [Paraburkholderia hospita]